MGIAGMLRELKTENDALKARVAELRADSLALEDRKIAMQAQRERLLAASDARERAAQLASEADEIDERVSRMNEALDETRRLAREERKVEQDLSEQVNALGSRIQSMAEACRQMDPNPRDLQLHQFWTRRLHAMKVKWGTAKTKYEEAITLLRTKIDEARARSVRARGDAESRGALVGELEARLGRRHDSIAQNEIELRERDGKVAALEEQLRVVEGEADELAVKAAKLAELLVAGEAANAVERERNLRRLEKTQRAKAALAKQNEAYDADLRALRTSGASAARASGGNSVSDVADREREVEDARTQAVAARRRAEDAEQARDRKRAGHRAELDRLEAEYDRLKRIVSAASSVPA